MQGDLEIKVNVLADDLIDRCEKISVGTSVYFGMFTEMESCCEVYKYKSILNVNKEREIPLCLFWF